MSAAPVRIAISLGDPAGIGPEVTRTALAQLQDAEVDVHLYGDMEALARAGGVPAGVACTHCATARTEPGVPRPEAAHGVVDAIRRAARGCLDGAHDALVTGPIAKSVLGRAGFTFPGHTELLEEIAGHGRAVMMLVGGALRVVPATIHCALRDVPARIRAADIAEQIAIVDRDLRERFGIARPRIAVCGLNPHAGEDGRFGDEEAREIAPAVRASIARGIDARGPVSADSVFSRAVRGELDVVVGMYHDQVLGPLKLHSFGEAVNVTLGLPLIRTSVDHGTAFDIAGRGEADPGSMCAALALACELVRRARRVRTGSGDSEMQDPASVACAEAERRA
jgi:4-hydroxythreonine-4-phosphate dehydrogenase